MSVPESLNRLAEIFRDIGAFVLMKKNRIVFRITEKHIEIMQCGSHYYDK